jgi:hypothetical protein
MVVLRFIARLTNPLQWKVMSVAVALAFAFVMSLTYSANAFVINTFAGEKYGRSFLTDAIQNGVLREVAAGDTLFVNGITESVRHFGDFRDSKYFIFQASGKKITTLSLDSVVDYFHCRTARCSVNTNTAFVMMNSPLDARTGYAIVGRISGVIRVTQGGISVSTPTLRDVLLYTSGPQLGSKAPAGAYGASWQSMGCTPRDRLADHDVRLNQLPDVRSGNDWRIVALPRSCGAIPLASLGVYSLGR